ncbi:MAG: hypothetical protein V1885_01110 [Candidatus Brennerbacteria bacterium]
MKTFQNLSLLKYARINAEGVAAIQRGDIVPFRGFGNSLKRRFLAAFTFAPFSVEELERRVLSPIAEIARASYGEFFLAGRDFTPHATILEGKWEGTDEAGRERAFLGVVEDSRMGDMAWREDLLMPSCVFFRFLLVNAGNILLTCGEIPPAVFAARKMFATIYAEYGLAPFAMDPILHITLGRMTKLPDRERLGEYLMRVRELRRNISRKPLALATSLFVGSTHDFIHRAP